MLCYDLIRSLSQVLATVGQYFAHKLCCSAAYVQIANSQQLERKQNKN